MNITEAEKRTNDWAKGLPVAWPDNKDWEKSPNNTEGEITKFACISCHKWSQSKGSKICWRCEEVGDNYIEKVIKIK